MSAEQFENDTLRYISGERDLWPRIRDDLCSSRYYKVACSCVAEIPGTVQRWRLRIRVWRAHYLPTRTRTEKGLALVAILLFFVVVVQFLKHVGVSG